MPSRPMPSIAQGQDDMTTLAHLLMTEHPPWPSSHFLLCSHHRPHSLAFARNALPPTRI